jgi:glucose-6-phosphate isomerase
MVSKKPALSASPAVEKLAANLAKLSAIGLRNIFNTDTCRHQNMIIGAAGIELNYSHNLVDLKTIALFNQLLAERDLGTKVTALFSGERVNNTEDRPALHSAIRAAILGQEAPHGDIIQAGYEKAKNLVAKIYNKEFTAANDEALIDVVNIGIGGSYLGPKLASDALADYDQNKVNIHFVANIDPSEMSDCLAKLDPDTTLFIISSKSFGTEETLSNAKTAINWLGQARLSQLFAVTSNVAAATKLGIHEDHCLPIWDWVGGRYSVWSNIGLPVMLKIGCDNFEQMLTGAYAMDQHFQSSTDVAQNMPLMMAALEIWHVNFQSYNSLAILPYNYRLKMLPDYLQQLTMESNGKSVDLNGKPTIHATNPVLWGSVGTEGQHSFHQLLHQGSDTIPCDFILPIRSLADNDQAQLKLVANCLAQRRALLSGKSLTEVASELLSKNIDSKTASDLAPHKTMTGNRPSNLITLDKITPQTFGATLALYEHKTFACSVLWNINPFDQWGVELGKKIGEGFYEQLQRDQTDLVRAIKNIDNPN